MPLKMERLLAMEPEQPASTATEYRTRYMSPRREDYIPHVALPKIGTVRPPTRSRSFLSFDVDPNSSFTSSEYRLGFTNHHPKRPFVFHAQPSHVFDFSPMPINTQSVVPAPPPPPTTTTTPWLSLPKGTEYRERFPNYRSYLSSQELLPPHIPEQPNMPSATQQKKERMTRSQYFHELITEHEKFAGKGSGMGFSEQQTAFQWPYRMSAQSQLEQYHPRPKYQSPLSALNIYEPLPLIQRTALNTSQ